MKQLKIIKSENIGKLMVQKNVLGITEESINDYITVLTIKTDQSLENDPVVKAIVSFIEKDNVGHINFIMYEGKPLHRNYCKIEILRCDESTTLRWNHILANNGSNNIAGAFTNIVTFNKSEVIPMLEQLCDDSVVNTDHPFESFKSI